MSNAESFLPEMQEFHPLHLPPPKARPGHHAANKADANDSGSESAYYWPCGHCTFFLGLCHFFSGFFLLGFDVATNNITETPFAITAALFFIVCAILSFIAARRIDLLAQWLIVVFCVISITGAGLLFYRSAGLINDLCRPESLESCASAAVVAHTGLVCISLFEVVVCLVAIFVIYRSLNKAYALPSRSTLVPVLAAGDYRRLQIEPVRIERRKYDTVVGFLLH